MDKKKEKELRKHLKSLKKDALIELYLQKHFDAMMDKAALKIRLAAMKADVNELIKDVINAKPNPAYQDSCPSDERFTKRDFLDYVIKHELSIYEKIRRDIWENTDVDDLFDLSKIVDRRIDELKFSLKYIVKN